MGMDAAGRIEWTRKPAAPKSGIESLAEWAQTPEGRATLKSVVFSMTYGGELLPHPALEVYCDMVLTGQKPLAGLPEVVPLEQITNVVMAKGLLWRRTDRYTWIYKHESLLPLILWLDERMDTSGEVRADNLLAHWVAGLAFGYGSAEIASWIKEHHVDSGDR